jgi:hypothetical protein
VPSDREEMFWRIGLLDGLKSPGLDEGVLTAVFDAAAGSIVEVQRGESRHVWGANSWEECAGSASRRHGNDRDDGRRVRCRRRDAQCSGVGEERVEGRQSR